MIEARVFAGWCILELSFPGRAPFIGKTSFKSCLSVKTTNLADANIANISSNFFLNNSALSRVCLND
jgi:hypothetical protein